MNLSNRIIEYTTEDEQKYSGGGKEVDEGENLDDGRYKSSPQNAYPYYGRYKPLPSHRTMFSRV